MTTILNGEHSRNPELTNHSLSPRVDAHSSELHTTAPAHRTQPPEGTNHTSMTSTEAMEYPRSKRTSTKVPNWQAYARTSFLYQAANYMASLPKTAIAAPGQENKALREEHGPTETPSIQSKGWKSSEDILGTLATSSSPDSNPGEGQGLSAYFASHISSIGLKTQAKCAPEIKRTICKRCKSILIPGKSSTSKIENLSRGSRKPWADVLVIRCKLCEMEKRYPVGAQRQPKTLNKLPRRDKRKDWPRINRLQSASR